MASLRIFIAAFAILATLLTAGAVGAARGQAMAVGEIVLCANGMAVTVPVDADGQPTGVPHWCPDCVLTLLTGLPAVPPLAAAPDGLTAAPCAAPEAQAVHVPPVPSSPARGPPRA